MKTDDKNANLDQCDILKIFFVFYDNLAKPPTGASNVHMVEKFDNKDDLTMLCEHG